MHLARGFDGALNAEEKPHSLLLGRQSRRDPEEVKRSVDSPMPPLPRPTRSR
jgi:hypothetical protein